MRTNRRDFGLYGMASSALAATAPQAHACEGAIPTWVAPLKQSLKAMAKRVKATLKPWDGPTTKAYPEDYGYGGSGLATTAIQAAIDALAAKGGGTVILRQGDYTSGTLILKSHIRLMINKGARLLGSLDLKDWPEQVAKRRTVQDTNMGMNQSLIFAEGCENIALSGEGVIDGRGQHYKGDETIHGTPGRPFMIRILDSTRVHISGLTMLDSPCWMQNYLNCDQVLIHHIKVENQANFNNDGLDIDGCRTVWVHHVDIRSGDDALCFKGASQRPTEDVLIEDSTLISSCNALKHGTDSQSPFRNVWARRLRLGGTPEGARHIKPLGADSAISWEMVDGGIVENILVSDSKIINVRSPFFLRIDDRGRVQPDQPKPVIGVMRKIVFENIVGVDNGPRGSFFLGHPARTIEDVALIHVKLEQFPSVKPVLTEDDLGDMFKTYPDAHMIDDKGDAPAFGLWAKHVTNLSLKNYRVVPNGADPRPEYVFKTRVFGVTTA